MSDAWEERVVRTDKDPITYESPVTERWNFQEVPCNVDRLLYARKTSYHSGLLSLKGARY